MELSYICTNCRLKELREEKNVSVQQITNYLLNKGLSKKTVSRETISKFENNERTVSSDILLGLAEYFNCSVDYLLGLSEARTTDTGIKEASSCLNISVKAAQNLADFYCQSEIIEDALNSDALLPLLAKLKNCRNAISRQEQSFRQGQPERLTQQQLDLADLQIVKALRACKPFLEELLWYNRFEEITKGETYDA